MERKPLNGGVALVTGASQGIGRAISLAFADAGAAVVISDLAIQRDAGEQAVSEIESHGGQAAFVVCDVTNESDIQNMIEFTVNRYGRLDVACNNAGWQCPPMRSVDVENADWDRVMSINLKGLWWCMKYELRQMEKQGHGGAIVNIASLAGLVGLDGLAPYCASKHAVVGLTKATALEYARTGIRVNAVCPGLVMTKLVRDFVGDDPATHQQIAEATPLGRPGTPEEIANAVLWLSSPAASFAIGSVLSVDGGWVAR
jgi:NAD(P)-dependent dehydrogenase (short-subunit alcohol dehydrogenase family)